MKLKAAITILIFLASLTMVAFGQTTQIANDYLGLANPILFNKSTFNLAWSSHPTEDYYKQEYLMNGDTLESFRKLVTIDILITKESIKDIVEKKIAELNKIKEANPVVHYETFEKNGEIMLDFLLSENSPDGKHINLIERNVYRYASLTDKNGQKGILLFAVSERAYGDAITAFFSTLKEHRFDLINSVGSFTIPAISIAK